MRSLRNAYLDGLRWLLRTTAQDRVVAAEYAAWHASPAPHWQAAAAAHDRWKAAPDWPSRDACIEAIAVALSAEIAAAEAVDDDEFAAAYKGPLTGGPARIILTGAELRHLAAGRGIERRFYAERFPGFPPGVCAGMRGYRWVWRDTGEVVDRATADGLLGLLWPSNGRSAWQRSEVAE